MINLINTTGYLNNSPNRFNKKNIIPSNIITMDNVNIPLLLRPNKGKPVIAMPNSGEYKFPKAKFVTEIPIGQMGGYAQNLLNDCPEGFVKDNSGNCIPDTGFNPGQYQNKGMPILPINNINNQNVGGTGALNKILNSPQSDENVSEYETKMKRKFGTPNIPAILGTNLLGFGLATVANNIEQGRQKSFMMNQMNNPLFNGSYSFAQNDYGTDPYEQTGQLRQYQQGGKFDPITYLYGDDEDKKEEIQEKKEIKKRKTPRITDENVDELSLLGLSIDDFLFSGKLPANFSANSVNKSGSSKGFRTFSSYEEGKQALHNQLNLYKTGKTKVGLKPSSTLLEAMSKYAPFGDGANNPIVYSNVIAKKLGITPNTPISQIDTKKWADAIEKVEGNKKGNNPGNIRAFEQGGEFLVGFETMMDLKKKGIKFKIIE